jgi:hypothetical protein
VSRRTLFWQSKQSGSYGGENHLPHPSKPKLTRCRRSTTDMFRVTDGHAFCTCEACRELIKRDVAGENNP